MALENLFKDLMTDTVTIEPYAGTDGYSKPSYGASVSYTARVEYRTRMVKNSDGKEVVSTATTYLHSAPAGLSARDRITLPDGKQPPILAIDKQGYKAANYIVAIFT